MQFRGQQNFRHGSVRKTGVLLVNLGTPDAATAGALKPYLKQFLSDPRVVETPRLIWWFILNFIVLTRRPKSSAHAYAQIWTDNGSPLLVYSQQQQRALAQRLKDQYHDKVEVELGMTYGHPSIATALQNLEAKGVEAIVVLPLYPQYSGATNGSVFDAIARELMRWRRVPGLSFIDAYYDEPLYINAIASSITEYRQQYGEADKLMFSYHGLPQRYLDMGDPYHCHCYKTTRLVAEQLGLAEDEYQLTFQSRFGKEPWLQPYTDKTLQLYPSMGIKSVQVITPGFSSDCVETLEEIDMQNREFFLQAGGESFSYIPCLNADPAHIEMMATLVNRHLEAIQQSPRFRQSEADLDLSSNLARQRGGA